MTRRRDRSLRAQARAILREARPSLSDVPAPPPAPSLTERARALYEDSVLPVREIARLMGVAERTILKYARKGNWKPRYRWKAHDPAKWKPVRREDHAPNESAKAGERHRGWQPTLAFAPVKGAGARFIKREDAGKPFPVGLKANDPAGAARAAAACEQAQEMSVSAQQQAERGGEACLDAVSRLHETIAQFAGLQREGRIALVNDASSRTFAACVGVALTRWEMALADMEAHLHGSVCE